MSDTLSGLKVDKWWHAFTAVGGAGFVAAIAVESKTIPQRDLILLSLSLFLFGVGQWINHPKQVQVVPGWKIEGHHRSPYPLGRCLELLGCLIFAVEVCRIVFTK